MPTFNGSHVFISFTIQFLYGYTCRPKCFSSKINHLCSIYFHFWCTRTRLFSLCTVIANPVPIWNTPAETVFLNFWNNTARFHLAPSIKHEKDLVCCVVEKNYLSYRHFIEESVASSFCEVYHLISADRSRLHGSDLMYQLHLSSHLFFCLQYNNALSVWNTPS